MRHQSAKEQIFETCQAIDLLIEKIPAQDDLSKLISGFLRNLSEGILVYLNFDDINAKMTWENIKLSSSSPKTNKDIATIKQFHADLQISFSHYTRNSEQSQRLLLKYLHFLSWVKEFILRELNREILINLDKFPIDQDPALQPYYQKIQDILSNIRDTNNHNSAKLSQRFYVHSCRPVFIKEGALLYEVSYYKATDSSTPQERLIAYSDYLIPTYYSVKLNIFNEHLGVATDKITVQLIDTHEVSIRPIEINNFGRLLGFHGNIKESDIVFKNVCRELTEKNISLYHTLTSDDLEFKDFISKVQGNNKNSELIEIIERARLLTKGHPPGKIVILYTIFRLRNRIIKHQIARYRGNKLKNVPVPHNITSRCYPFEKSPFSSSLVNHNPSYGDLLQILNPDEYAEGILFSRIKRAIDNSRTIYHSIEDFKENHQSSSDLVSIVNSFNNSLDLHTKTNEITIQKNTLSILNYENHLLGIIDKINSRCGDSNYTEFAKRWIDNCPEDYLKQFDREKIELLPKIFEDNSVAFIYGPAGTGKSTMINFISNLFRGEKKLFLTYTYPAMNNLISRVASDNQNIFSTIKKFLSSKLVEEKYKIVIIDESSTVDNKTIYDFLREVDSEYILFVGDNYQIESISFGNWFDVCRNNSLSMNKFELTKIHRANNEELKLLWESVRERKSNIPDRLASLNISNNLTPEIFNNLIISDDSIILSLSYGGLYGINSLNRYFQELNPGRGFTLDYTLYKENDPIIFFETDTFKNTFYNNQKGIIKSIHDEPGIMIFHIEFYSDHFGSDGYPINKEYDFVEVLSPKECKITLLNSEFYTEESEIPNESPFRVAYALSIHKAQGLEYKHVNIIINESDSNLIDYKIFYTAITRARESLNFFWSPNTQHKIIESFKAYKDISNREIGLLRPRKKI